jgi:hypothetical protein
VTSVWVLFAHIPGPHICWAWWHSFHRTWGLTQTLGKPVCRRSRFCENINKFKKVEFSMEFYSATKKNEILSFASKRMELENIMLSEVSQTQKAKNRMFSPICRL